MCSYCGQLKILVVQDCRFSEAKELYQQLTPDTVEAITSAPFLFETESQIRKARADFVVALDRLVRGNHTSQTKPYHKAPPPFVWTRFYSVYHGENDRHLSETLATFYLKYIPGIRLTAPHLSVVRACACACGEYI
jgi:hypothetical protein